MSAIANTFLAGSAVSAASTAPRARRAARRAAPATRAAAKDDADRLGPVEAIGRAANALPEADELQERAA